MEPDVELAKGFDASLKGWLRLGGFLALIVGFIPVLLIMRSVNKEKADRIPRIFHGCVMRLIGVKIRVRGKIEEEQGTPTIYVSNHSSYVDVPVLGSVIQACFVAKSEVATWPLIGGLARLQNTVFIERRSSRASVHRDVLRECLESGKSLIFFPEGTSSDGMRTLPFKSTLFSIAEKPLSNGQKVRIQPISVLCTEIGGYPIGRSWRPYYAWFGDMTLVKHAWELFKIGAFTVDVIFHQSVNIDDCGNRKLLSDYCQRTIADGVDQCVTGRFNKALALRA